MQAPVDGGRALTAAAVARAERLVEQHRYADAVAAIGSVHVPSVAAPDLVFRTLLAEGWSQLHLGGLDAAEKALADLLERARRAGIPPGWLR